MTRDRQPGRKRQSRPARRRLGLAFALPPCASPLQALLPERIRGSPSVPCSLRLLLPPVPEYFVEAVFRECCLPAYLLAERKKHVSQMPCIEEGAHGRLEQTADIPLRPIVPPGFEEGMGGHEEGGEPGRLVGKAGKADKGCQVLEGRSRMPMKRAGYRRGWPGRRSGRRPLPPPCGPRALLSWMPGRLCPRDRGLEKSRSCLLPGDSVHRRFAATAVSKALGSWNAIPSARTRGRVAFLNCCGHHKEHVRLYPCSLFHQLGREGRNAGSEAAAALERKGRSCRRRRSSPRATQDSPPTGTATQ